MFKKNQKQTLVLSGGGALGFAHIGIIKALEEKEILYNEIIGTSMGAIVGSFLSVGYTYKQIIEIIEELNYKKLLKINVLHLNSLIDQKNIRKFLTEKIGEITFNQTQIELKIIATNLETGKSKIFDKTTNVKIVDAICASLAIPGIFKPYPIENQIYIDGFLSSNLPFEFSTNKKILAIDINTEKYIQSHKHKFAPQILEKSVHIMILNQTRDKLKHNKNKQLKIIGINLEKFKTYDFHNWEKILNQGYKQFIENYQ